MKAYPIHEYISVPTKYELEQDIEQAKEYAKEHPGEAAYFKIKEEEYKKELAILNDPKNANIDPNTKAGAEKLANLMNKATQGLEEEANVLVRENPSLIKFGWLMGKRNWIRV